MSDYEVSERVGLLLEARASDPLNERVAEICRVAVAEAAVATSQTLKFTEKRLLARADALDPEGATR